ncbi:MAG: hypothetical protein ABUS57_13675 [Pseudomonadota bacterium]
MTRFRIFTAIACVAALTACAKPKPGPDAAVTGIYNIAVQHVGKDATPDDAIPMTDDLKQVVDRASAEAQRRDEPFIDGDLVLGCQDCTAPQNLQITVKTPPANGHAVVEASFKMYDDQVVIDYDMTETPQGWRVDNIRGPADFDLRKAAQEELSQQAAATTTQAACSDERGAQAAAALVAQCVEVSPATHPPCNAANSCAMIEDEIKRGCGLLADGSKPAYCAAHP